MADPKDSTREDLHHVSRLHQRQFRRFIGYQQLVTLVLVIERDLASLRG